MLHRRSKIDRHWHSMIGVGGIVATVVLVFFVGSETGFAQSQSALDSSSKAESTTTFVVDYLRDIQPIFESHCYPCHGPTKQESNYRLDLRARAMGTGDHGAAPINPGESSTSLLIQFVSGDGDLLMPPENLPPLSAAQVDLLRRWVDAGADWPAGGEELEPDHITTDHWSFQALAKVVPPDLGAPIQFPLQSALDRFVLASLIENGLSPSPAADRVSLIRRVYLDMLGLLPTPEQVAAFVEDPAPAAYEQLVENVLASPHYGERWARHWLDVVRFGESTGYEVNRDRANAYYYRDYVIEALNSDKPYRDFVMEQIAGDALGVDEATGFLVGGPYDIVKSPDINLTLMQREDQLADYVNTTATTFLGLTVGCARCHNHKFDPILQRDYFAIQAIFAGVEHGERKLIRRSSADLSASIESVQQELDQMTSRLAKFKESAPATAEITDRLPVLNPAMNCDEFAPTLAKWIRFKVTRTNQAEPCLDELEIYAKGDETNLALASLGGVASSGGDYAGNPKHQLEHINDGQYGNHHSWIASQTAGAWVQIALPEPRSIQKVIWGRDRQGQFSDRLAIRYSIEVSLDDEHWQEVFSSHRRQPFLVAGQAELEGDFIERLPTELAEPARKLLAEIDAARIEAQRLEGQIPLAYLGQFKEPQTIYRLHRGDPLAPREEVLPDTLTVLGTLGLENSTPEQQRRLMFAHWLVSEKNPLTARVIVNRVWHYHFGQGIVATTSDFGKNGGAPTHPELLDWLATEFMAHGWSLKWLHRQILLSSTYRQAATPRAESLAIDADSKLLWRFPPRRLEAEAIRDCVLQASGKLNLAAGGPGFLLFKIDRENVHHYFPLEEFTAEHFRRMIYMTKIRQEQDDVFGAFDCPDGGQTMPNRNQSTTALQALNLMNSPFIIEQAEFFAQRLETSAGKQPQDQVRLAYELLFSRLPTELETSDALSFIQQQGLMAFCRALLNANEFLFLS